MYMDQVLLELLAQRIRSDLPLLTVSMIASTLEVLLGYGRRICVRIPLQLFDDRQVPRVSYEVRLVRDNAVDLMQPSRVFSDSAVIKLIVELNAAVERGG